MSHEDDLSEGAPRGEAPGADAAEAPLAPKAASRRASSAARRIVVAIGGLDPSGGAGLAADLRVIRQLGFHPAPVCSALTAQGEAGVAWWEPVPPEAVVAQLRAVLATGPVAAVKIGMVGDVALVEPLRRALTALEGVPLVFDPVLVASAGRSLLRGDPSALFPLLRRASVVTPNLPELAVLTGLAVSDLPSLREAARLLGGQGVRAVLAKGGHLPGPPVDVLYDGAGFHEFPAERLDVGPVRGTGCFLAAALACALGLGTPLPDAVGAARRLLREAFLSAYGLGGRLRYL